MEEELQHTSDTEGKKRNLKLLQIVTVFIILLCSVHVISCKHCSGDNLHVFYNKQRYS